MPYKDRQKRLEYLKKYNAQYQPKRYKKRKAELINALGGKCVVCGAKNNLEFDHIIPSTKSFTIMSHWHDDVEEELKKCQLLCKKCHLRKTCVDLNWERNIGKTKAEKQKIYQKRWYEKHKEEYNAKRRDRRKTQNALQKRSTGGST